MENTRGSNMKKCIFMIAVVVIWFMMILTWYELGGDEALRGEGSLSDRMNAAMALFTGLTLTAVIGTLVLQSEELKLQRQELSETREELRRSAEANEQAAKLAKDNLDAQKKMSYELNHNIRSQIESERIHGIINLIYKKIEYTTHPNSMGARGAALNDESAKINSLLDKLEELSRPPSTPEA